MNKLYWAFIAFFGAVVFVMVFGAPGANAAQIYKTCGDTPGFCPNPPEVSHCDETGNIALCE